MIFDFFERSDSDLRHNPPKTFGEAIARFLRETLSDTLTMVLVSIVLGAILVGIVAFHFGVPFMTALGGCALLVIAIAAFNFFSN